MTDSQPLPRPEAAMFYERQCFRQLWLTLLFIVCLAAVVIPPLLGIRTNPEKAAEIIWATSFGAVTLLAAMFLVRNVNMQVWIMPDGIHIRYMPMISHRIIRYSEIEKHESVLYRPIVEYGGWGTKGIGKHRAYNVYGNRGVKLWFTNSKTLLLGSQNAEELADAITDAMR